MNAVGEPILDRDGANRVPSIASPALTIVIPTLNERENIEPLVELLTAALRGIAWGALFVDGASPDGTAEHVQTLAHSNPRIRSMQRTRPDLAAAVIEGVLASASPFVAVMDADLQHDERLLPEMMKVLEHGDDVDLVVGSRYIVGGGVGDWNRRRARLSSPRDVAGAPHLQSGSRGPAKRLFHVSTRGVRTGAAPNVRARI